MTVRTSVLWKMNIHMAKKWPEMVVTLSFISIFHFRSDYTYLVHMYLLTYYSEGKNPWNPRNSCRAFCNLSLLFNKQDFHYRQHCYRDAKNGGWRRKFFNWSTKSPIKCQRIINTKFIQAIRSANNVVMIHLGSPVKEFRSSKNILMMILNLLR